jgi:hypothetical protein
MTQTQAIRLVCRAIVVYLLFWTISDLIALPHELLAVEEAWNYPGLSTRGTFYLRDQILFLAGNVLRIAIWLALALWFYQGGPRIQRWFGVEVNVEPAEVQTNID